jgi:hypothetical protein
MSYRSRCNAGQWPTCKMAGGGCSYVLPLIMLCLIAGMTVFYVVGMIYDALHP